MLKDIIKNGYYVNKCHPLFFLFKIFLAVVIIFFSGPAYMPFACLLVSLSVVDLGSRMDYMIPMTIEERLKRLKFQIYYKSSKGTLVCALAMIRLRYLPIFHQRVMVYHPVYIVLSAILITTLGISVAVETGQGIEAKGFISFDENGKKKKKRISFDFICYIVNLFGFIALNIFLFSAEDGDKPFVNSFNIFMIIAIVVTVICLIDAILLVKRIEIYDYTGDIPDSVIGTMGM